MGQAESTLFQCQDCTNVQAELNTPTAANKGNDVKRESKVIYVTMSNDSYDDSRTASPSTHENRPYEFFGTDEREEASSFNHHSNTERGLGDTRDGTCDKEDHFTDESGWNSLSESSRTYNTNKVEPLPSLASSSDSEPYNSLLDDVVLEENLNDISSNNHVVFLIDNDSSVIELVPPISVVDDIKRESETEIVEHQVEVNSIDHLVQEKATHTQIDSDSLLSMESPIDQDLLSDATAYSYHEKGADEESECVLVNHTTDSTGFETSLVETRDENCEKLCHEDEHIHEETESVADDGVKGEAFSKMSLKEDDSTKDLLVEENHEQFIEDSNEDVDTEHDDMDDDIDFDESRVEDELNLIKNEVVYGSNDSILNETDDLENRIVNNIAITNVNEFDGCVPVDSFEDIFCSPVLPSSPSKGDIHPSINYSQCKKTIQSDASTPPKLRIYSDSLSVNSSMKSLSSASSHPSRWNEQQRSVCMQKYDPNLFSFMKECSRCFSLASEKDQQIFKSKGSVRTIPFTKGGCASVCPYVDCKIESEGVRMCRRCFTSLHHNPQVEKRKLDKVVDVPIPLTPRKSMSPTRVSESIKPQVMECNGKFQPHIFQNNDGCERCLSLLSNSERSRYEKNSNSPLVTKTSGGCHEACQFFQGVKGSCGVRLCMRCFQSLHKPMSDMLKVKDESICDRGRPEPVTRKTSPIRSDSRGRSVND